MGSMPNLYDILSELNYIHSNPNSHSSSLNIQRQNNNNNTTDNTTINDDATITTDNNGKIINTFPYTLKEFNNFLVRTHCEENLEFFIMTRQFLLNDDKKSLRSSNVSAVSSRNYSSFDLELWDDQIYSIFIKVDSPKECNLPQYIRELFDDCHNKNNPPRQVCIIQAIQHILGLLLDAYKRFVQYIQQIPDEEWDRRRKNIELERQQQQQLAIEQLAIETQQRNLEQSRLSKRGSSINRPHPNNNNDSHTSILFKSRKFFNKFKKTIQI
ncbi:hypothetical protein MOSE0_G07976 [Monosporozyma servazzii]